MPQNEEHSTENLTSRAENEEHSTKNHDWDDMSPDSKQRFQELARGDTEHRTEFSALHDELCAIADLLSEEEDYTND